MRARLLLRSLALVGVLVAGLLAGAAPAGAEQAPAKLPPGTPKTFIKTLNMFDMQYRYQAGVATVEDSKDPIHGARAYTTIEQPSVGLMEASGFAISVTDSVDPGNVVRVGWEVNPTDPDYSEAPFAPHLFAEHWVDGVNRGDEPFLAISGVPQLGDVLTPSDNLYEFKIARVGGNWWVAFNGYYLGDFPDSEWGGQFTSAIIASWNGAVGSTVFPDCSDMGRNGLPGTDPAAALVTLVSVLRVDDEIHISPPRIMGEIPRTDPALYSAGNIDPASQSFRYGGDGDC